MTNNYTILSNCIQDLIIVLYLIYFISIYRSITSFDWYGNCFNINLISYLNSENFGIEMIECMICIRKYITQLVTLKCLDPTFWWRIIAATPSIKTMLWQLQELKIWMVASVLKLRGWLMEWRQEDLLQWNRVCYSFFQ